MAAIRNTLTYLVPDSLTVQPGQRVQVPLATRKATGIVLRAGSTLPPGIQARPILRVLDTEPVLTPELLELGLWIADYYVAPIGEVFRAMLPLRADTRRARSVRLSALGQQKLQEINQARARTGRPRRRSPQLPCHARQRFGAGAPPEILRSFLAGAEEKWLVVDEVERERTQRQVYAVRAGGPRAGKTAAPLAGGKKNSGSAGSGRAGGRPSRTSPYRTRGSCRPQKLSASGLDRT